jgi:hypothetical protein
MPETILEANKAFVNEECNVFLFMQDDGNLVVKHGTPDNQGAGIWDSNGYVNASRSGYYFTYLQADGNLITSTGSTDDPGDSIWDIGYTGVEGEYFLGIDCNLEIISVYQGT